MGGLSWWHWMIVLAAFVLLFGAKKLPDAARGVGRSLRILKSEVGAMHDDEPNDDQPRNDSTEATTTPVPVCQRGEGAERVGVIGAAVDHGEPGAGDRAAAGVGAAGPDRAWQ